MLRTVRALLLSSAILCVPVRLAAQSPARPQITGIARVAVYASDLGKAQQFYGAFLGFPQTAPGESKSSRRYRVNASQSIQVIPLPGGETDDLAYVAFATSDVQALRRYLLSKRVPLEGGVQERADGAHFFWVKDPEGHRIQFVQPPASRQDVRAAKHPAPKEQPISHHILHAGFIVHDQAAEDHFYRDVLGFRSAWYGGMVDGRTDFVDMQVPDGTDWLEYMLHSPAPPTATVSGILNHLALGVGDIHKAAELLQQRGWKPSSRSHAQIGRDGKWQLNLYDPNGTRVELMELRPVRTPCCSPYSVPVPPADRP
ncbi:MAG TPA: VOC family protein [Acidobacteriaceae bacterium]|nr:VOC family protein [Acidobacteriaceae bacterium]